MQEGRYDNCGDSTWFPTQRVEYKKERNKSRFSESNGQFPTDVIYWHFWLTYFADFFFFVREHIPCHLVWRILYNKIVHRRTISEYLHTYSFTMKHLKSQVSTLEVGPILLLNRYIIIIIIMCYRSWSTAGQRSLLYSSIIS